MSAYESIIAGLNEAIEYEKGTGKARVSKWTIKEVPEFSGDDIRRIRMEAGYTQAAFAMVLGVSAKAVEAWECGRNQPQGPARRLIGLMHEDEKLFERLNVVSRETDDEAATA